MNKLTDAFRVGQQAFGAHGQFAHPQLLDHSERLKESFYKVGEHACNYEFNGKIIGVTRERLNETDKSTKASERRLSLIHN